MCEFREVPGTRVFQYDQTFNPFKQQSWFERIIHDSFWIICIIKSYEQVQFIQKEVGRRLEVVVLAGYLKAIRTFREITKDEIHISLLS